MVQKIMVVICLLNPCLVLGVNLSTSLWEKLVLGCLVCRISLCKQPDVVTH